MLNFLCSLCFIPICLFLFPEEQAGLPIGFPPQSAEHSVDRMAPQDHVIMLSWAGSEKADLKAEEKFLRIFAEPEIQAMLTKSKELYDQFHLDEPWHSKHNKTLIAKMPDMYLQLRSTRAGVPEATAEKGITNFLGAAGEKSLLHYNLATKKGVLEDTTGANDDAITDGKENTLLIVETNPENGVVWTKPEDFEALAMLPVERLTGSHNGGFHILMAGGSVRFIPATIKPETLRALFTKDGGEEIDWDKIGGAVLKLTAVTSPLSTAIY